MEENTKEIEINVATQNEAIAKPTATSEHIAIVQNNTAVANKKNYAFGKTNFICIAVSMIIVIIGFILMSGSSSDETTFDADIFSTMRIKVAPVVCFVGFVSMIFGIVHKTKDSEEEKA